MKSYKLFGEANAGLTTCVRKAIINLKMKNRDFVNLLFNDIKIIQGYYSSNALTMIWAREYHYLPEYKFKYIAIIPQ